MSKPTSSNTFQSRSEITSSKKEVSKTQTVTTSTVRRTATSYNSMSVGNDSFIKNLAQRQKFFNAPYSSDAVAPFPGTTPKVLKPYEPVYNSRVHRNSVPLNSYSATASLSKASSNPFKKEFGTSIRASATSLPALPTTENNKPNANWKNPETKPKTPLSWIWGGTDNKPSTSTTFPRTLSKSEEKPLKPKQKPGLMYIFNQEKFDDNKLDREGSKKDVARLKKVFENIFKLDVTVCENYTVTEINEKISKIKKKDFTKYSCIAIALLSHGYRHDTVLAKDGSFNIDNDILFPLLKIASLQDKPKIIITQSCKGSIDLRYPQTDSQLINSPITMGSPSEIIKCYSTFEGHVALRGKDGSVFIQTFCNFMEIHGKTKCIETIMKMVISEVKKITQNQQVPYVSVNLTKSYIFGDYI